MILIRKKPNGKEGFSSFHKGMEVYYNNILKIMRKKIMHEGEFCCNMVEKTRIKSQSCFLVDKEDGK
ncbi:hypothetical protein [Peribacillus sp. NPDC097895]|uniref:hypothetical protein n=1 Tax=Peribacillus sp. NPDC097895 TaxID=3390619 RepID=UPI003D01B1C4